MRVLKSTASFLLSIAGLLMALAIASSNTTARQSGAGSKVAPQKSDSQLIHSLEGADLYRAYCAACHGPEAHGDGHVAAALKTKPLDLTLITKRHGGVFPADEVSKVISGEASPTAHGSREMPIWGPIFHQVEADQDWGAVRLKNLTRYLESIQKR